MDDRDKKKNYLPEEKTVSLPEHSDNPDYVLDDDVSNQDIIKPNDCTSVPGDVQISPKKTKNKKNEGIETQEGPGGED